VIAIDALRLLAMTDLDRLDAASSVDRFEALTRAAIPGSVAIELRDRRRPIPELLTLGQRLRTMTRESGQLFVVNDRLDLALLLEADGVHLGEASVRTRDARSLIGGRFVIRACHRPERCAETDAEIVLLSPICEARKGNRALGLEALGEARKALQSSGSSAQLFALGGVDAARASACMAAGAAGVAAIDSILCRGEGEPLLRALGIQRCSEHD
jgi:thiamine-phosphate pyrophosphorylase